MPNDKRILDAFHKMDPRRQQEAITRMERIAKAFPAKPERAPVKLRLVAGGSR